MTGYPNRVIFPLDVPTLTEAVSLARRLAPYLAAVKIGNQLFTAEGPEAVRAMHDLGLRVFLDLKFHDIPNTVAGAIASARSLGVWMVNVHASGGPAMMTAAAQAVAASRPASAPGHRRHGPHQPRLTGHPGHAWHDPDGAAAGRASRPRDQGRRSGRRRGLAARDRADPPGMRARLRDRDARGPTGRCGPERSAARHDPRSRRSGPAPITWWWDAPSRRPRTPSRPPDASMRNAEPRMRNRARSVRIRQTAFRTPHFAFETIESSARGVAC